MYLYCRVHFLYVACYDTCCYRKKYERYMFYAEFGCYIAKVKIGFN